ncbi:MAG: hypothetical protein NVSMB26_08870 [Beijerinckiaceae bacterium]
MFSYHARRRNLSHRQAVYQALFCEPGAKACQPIHVSKAYLGHLRGKRARSVCVEGQKRTLVDTGRTRAAAAPLNELVAKCLGGSGPAAKPILVRGPAWLLLEEESWFCLWRRMVDGNDLRSQIEPLVSGKHLVETVRLPDAGDIALWQRWLFCDEADFVAVRRLTGMQPCDEIRLPKKSAEPQRATCSP